MGLLKYGNTRPWLYKVEIFFGPWYDRTEFRFRNSDHLHLYSAVYCKSNIYFCKYLVPVDITLPLNVAQW